MKNRISQVLRCFSLTESQEEVVDGLNLSDFQTQSKLGIPTPDIAKRVSDNILDFMVSGASDHIYSMYDSTFSEDSESILITFFPNIEDLIEDLTEFTTNLDDVSSVQWSRVLPADSENLEEIEYFIVLKVNLNIESTVSLKTVMANIPAEISSEQEEIEVPPVPNGSSEGGEYSAPKTDLISKIKQIIELQ
jgi:hypothetical protein